LLSVVVTPALLSNPTKAIDQMLQTFTEEAEQYPLMPRAGNRAGEAVAERLSDLVNGFIQHAQGNIIFDSDASLVTVLITWVTTMTTSVVRTIRHTGTLLGSGKDARVAERYLICPYACSHPFDDRPD
jgi:hypothetical protein